MHFKTFLVRVPLHVSVYIYDHLQGAREQYFVQLLSWICLNTLSKLFSELLATNLALIRVK
jgi:hypothetical protein